MQSLMVCVIRVTDFPHPLRGRSSSSVITRCRRVIDVRRAVMSVEIANQYRTDSLRTKITLRSL